jgi:hypothetical protein
MDTIFKVGDKVFDVRYGWGVVSSVNIRTKDWPVEVVFDGEEELLDEYTFDGRAFINYPPTLSFTEYTLEGFSQERPEELPKKGDIVWGRDKDYQNWHIYHFSHKTEDGLYHLSSDNSRNAYILKQITTINPYANEQ